MKDRLTALSQLLPKQQFLLITVAALGYFVDIYDLILFQVIKTESLLALGLSESEISVQEVYLFNWQMAGMLVGGLIWGILGDKLGRLKVLFGSILLYSLANIANAYVWDIESYAAVRFFAGLGLAGELGAGITLVAEVMDKEHRGYGTMVIVTFGALGAVAAALIGDLFPWKVAYWVGGVMGLALLFLRIGTIESGMYQESVEKKVKRGNFLMLFASWPRFLKYMACIGLGFPVWFIVGVLVNLTERYFAPALQLSPKVETGTSVMFCYIGLSLGDLFGGIFSQVFRSRLSVIKGYLVFCLMVGFIYLFGGHGASSTFYYTLCLLLGIAAGYWALFVTVAAEQFGTNIRATVANTVPNFVRGAVIPISISFKYLHNHPSFGTIPAAIIVGLSCVIIAGISAFYLRETFGKNLNYLE